MSDLQAAVARGLAVLDARGRGVPAADKSARCPCCGQAAVFEKVVVSLDQNCLSLGGRTVVLTRLLAEVAYVLAQKMPGTVRQEAMFTSVWGSFADADLRNTFDVLLVKLRRALNPLGISIETVRGVGWRMIVREKDHA